MRQPKLSDLIHSSKGYENLDACSVEIYFEDIIDLVMMIICFMYVLSFIL